MLHCNKCVNGQSALCRWRNTGVRTVPHRVVPRDERLLKPTGVAGLAISVLLLCLVAAGSGYVSLRTQRATAETRALQRDREAATGSLLLLERAETGQRGFLITGRETYLGTYQDAVDRAPAALAQLSESQHADAAVTRMAELARIKLTELARTIELTRDGRKDEALALVQTDVGQNAMVEFRALSANLLSAENARLAQLVARIGRDTRVLVWLDLGAVAVVLALAAQLLLGVRRAVNLLRLARHGLAQANEQLSQSNERLERAVQRRTAELTHANDEIQRFAYIVSHDLRSPLVNVMGFTSELEAAQATLVRHIERTDVPEPVRLAVVEDMPESIRFIRASTAKMDRLINAILRLSREGRRRLAPEAIDLAEMLRTVADTMAHAVQSTGASITVNDVPPIRSDRLALEQVFANLLENALKYAKPGRPARVEISGVRAGARIRYAVADNGRGIAVRDLDRIFDLFRRAGDQSVPGEGIGLAHVRTLVRRLGGTITCTSEPGVGTVFTVDLPAEPAQQLDPVA